MQRSPSPEFDPSNARQGHMAQIQPPLNNPPSPAEAQAFLSPPVDERPQSMMSDEDIGAPSNSEQKLSSPSTYLHRSYFAFFLVFLYSVFAVFAWSLIGILSVRPIGARSYGMSIFPDENDGYNHSKLSDFLHRYSNSENYYRAAKVINAGLGVLTLPLATAICVRAAVTYTQQRRHGFTIRQAMALADQGWISPDIWLKLIHPRKGLRRYGSTLLWLAMLLHILGFVIAPIQQLFLSEKKIHVPTSPTTMSYLTDIWDLFPSRDDPDTSGLYVAHLRSAITATSVNDFQSNLWLTNTTNCTLVDNGGKLHLSLPQSCWEGGGGVTLSASDDLSPPFVAQLPSSFNTGLIRQFAPRLNSSVTFDTVQETEFPKDCDKLPEAFYTSYSGGADCATYSLQACLPSDQTETPWKKIRQRQDITETLYLNISINVENTCGDEYRNTTVFKVGSKSSLGYFELPSYLNNNVPGPLLDEDPNELCDLHCLTQGFNAGPMISNHENRTHLRRRSSDDVKNGTAIETTNDYSLEVMQSRPPLLATAMALFGENSYIATRTRNPSLYLSTAPESVLYDTTAARYQYDLCNDFMPLIGLTDSLNGDNSVNFGWCIQNGQTTDVAVQVAGWLRLFWHTGGLPSPNSLTRTPQYLMQTVFTAALYLSHSVLLTKGFSSMSRSLTVNYDLGAASQIPAISAAGIVTVAVLWGLFIAALFAMAGYAGRVVTWTSALDSFAMMRIGADMARDVPLLVCADKDAVTALDESPGWVGDAEPESDMGELGLGAHARLRGKRRFASYGS